MCESISRSRLGEEEDSNRESPFVTMREICMHAAKK